MFFYTCFSSVSIVDFEQVNVSWVRRFEHIFPIYSKQCENIMKKKTKEKKAYMNFHLKHFEIKTFQIKKLKELYLGDGNIHVTRKI